MITRTSDNFVAAKAYADKLNAAQSHLQFFLGGSPLLKNTETHAAESAVSNLRFIAEARSVNNKKAADAPVKAALDNIDKFLTVNKIDPAAAADLVIVIRFSAGTKRYSKNAVMFFDAMKAFFERNKNAVEACAAADALDDRGQLAEFPKAATSKAAVETAGDEESIFS